MGWPWSSSDSSAPSAPPPQREPLPEPADPSPVAQTETLPPQTRDQAANAELLAFLASLQTPSPPTPTPTSASGNPPQTTSPTGPPLTPPTSSSSEAITPHTLYPTTISCRNLFDSAFYCQSPGGQFKNIYRYGTLRDCSPLWKDFWWCMRTNRGWMGEEEREKRVLRHEWEREGERLRERGGSSEDVWGGRRRVLRGAFAGEWPKGGGWGEPLTQGGGGEGEDEEQEEGKGAGR